MIDLIARVRRAHMIRARTPAELLVRKQSNLGCMQLQWRQTITRLCEVAYSEIQDVHLESKITSDFTYVR